MFVELLSNRGVLGKSKRRKWARDALPVAGLHALLPKREPGDSHDEGTALSQRIVRHGLRVLFRDSIVGISDRHASDTFSELGQDGIGGQGAVDNVSRAKILQELRMLEGGCGDYWRETIEARHLNSCEISGEVSPRDECVRQ